MLTAEIVMISNRFACHLLDDDYPVYGKADLKKLRLLLENGADSMIRAEALDGERSGSFA